MNTLIIDGVEHEINDEVANLVLLISKERDELKEALEADKEPVADVLCSDWLALSLENVKKSMDEIFKEVESDCRASRIMNGTLRIMATSLNTEINRLRQKG